MSRLEGFTPGVDLERAEMLILRNVGIHRIREAVFFADILKQAAAHAPAEHGVEYAHRHAHFRAEAVRGHAQAYVRLLYVLDLDQTARVDAFLLEVRGGRRRPFELRGKKLVAYLFRLRKSDVPGDGNDHVFGHVILVHIREDILFREPVHVFGRTEHGAPQPAFAEITFRQQIETEVLRRVVAHVNFFLDNALFPCAFLVVEHGIEKQVRTGFPRWRGNFSFVDFT